MNLEPSPEFVEAREAVLEQLRERARTAQREGDMSMAAQLLYGAIPQVEQLLSVCLLRRLQNGALMIGDDSDVYLARPIDSISLADSDEALKQVAEALPELISPSEALEWLKARARELIGRGDYEAASRVETELIPPYESWLAQHRVFNFDHESSSGRMLMRDEDGTAWIAARLEDV